MRRRTPLAIAGAMIAMVLGCSPPSTDATAPTPPFLAKGGGKKVRSVSVSPSAATLAVGGTVQLTATASPNGSATGFAWASSNSSVAAVSSSGLVTGVAAGTATITATAIGSTVSGSATVTVTQTAAGENLVGAGDIASCGSSGDEATAALLAGISGTVYTLGDNVYDNGTTTEFTSCYDPSWGAARPRTKPSPGNHDYNTAGATGYYGYFGAAAGDPTKGYYSYDLGTWHIVVLNSNISMAAGSAQEQWLRADLAATPNTACTLAYWHHPRFSSGQHGNNSISAPIWQALYDFDAEVILVGHDHDYERFAPQDPAGAADAARGIRQFVVGTGGRSHYALGTLKPNSEVFNGTTYGVLKLTLGSGQYAWQFVPVAGATFTDSGSGSCH